MQNGTKLEQWWNDRNNTRKILRKLSEGGSPLIDVTEASENYRLVIGTHFNVGPKTAAAGPTAMAAHKTSPINPGEVLLILAGPSSTMLDIRTWFAGFVDKENLLPAKGNYYVSPYELCDEWLARSADDGGVSVEFVIDSPGKVYGAYLLKKEKMVVIRPFKKDQH